MARFYPTTIKDFNGSIGEKLVYEAFQKLDNSYCVLHSYHWLGEKGSQHVEGEADFLILHPGDGIMAIEVKAGEISLKDGVWKQTNHQTQKTTEIDPFGQATASQYRLRSYLREKSAKGTSPMVCRAVWFPSVIVPNNIALPLEATREIIFDADSLNYPKEALDFAFSYWRKQEDNHSLFTPAQCEYTLQLLLPTLHITQTIAGTAAEGEIQYIQLNAQQIALLQYLREQPTAAIRGPAGTGKTLLALEKAKMLAEDGKKVLYLCYNEFLMSYIRQHNIHTLITYHNVRSLAEEIMKNKSIPIDQVIPTFEKFLATEYKKKKWPYNNIIIDEGQDLSDNLLGQLQVFAEERNGTFYIFYDRNQYIFGQGRSSWIEDHSDCRLVLYKNCRNTEEIARYIASIMKIKSSYYENNIHGLPPEISYYQTPTELKEIAEEFVKTMLKQKLHIEDIVILSVHSIPHSGLNGIKELAGVPLSNLQEPGKIFFTSVRKFKGLEAKAVLLIDIEKAKTSETLIQRLVYVGASRASAYLHLAFCQA